MLAAAPLAPLLVVTPNLCFDRTVRVSSFEAGTVSRPFAAERTAGGKGVNVVRALRCLGAAPTLLGLVPADDGEVLVELLRAEGQALLGVPVDGAVRQATIVVEDSGRATVFNESGPTVGIAEQRALLTAVEDALEERPGAVVACSGSLPPGLPDDTYGRVVEVVHRHRGLAVIDAARAALRAALPYRPDVVTPNLAEAIGMTTGATLEAAHAEDGLEAERAAALTAAHELRSEGAVRAVVTVGSHGVAWVDADGAEHWLDAHVVEVANPIGAGDAFVAGLAAALGHDASDWPAAVARATAVAAAAVEHPRAGMLDVERARTLQTGVMR